MQSRVFKSRALVSLFLLGCVLSCGGGTMTQNQSQSQSQNTMGPTAILNGPNLLGIGSSWVSADCSVDVELTSDNSFGFIIGTTSGSNFSGTGTWTPFGTNGASFVVAGALAGSAGLDTFVDISGSTSSKKFTADVTVTNSLGGQQDLGTCVFSLQVGPLNIFNP